METMDLSAAIPTTAKAAAAVEEEEAATTPRATATAAPRGIPAGAAAAAAGASAGGEAEASRPRVLEAGAARDGGAGEDLGRPVAGEDPPPSHRGGGINPA